MRTPNEKREGEVPVARARARPLALAASDTFRRASARGMRAGDRTRARGGREGPHGGGEWQLHARAQQGIQAKARRREAPGWEVLIAWYKRAISERERRDRREKTLTLAVLERAIGHRAVRDDPDA